MADHRRPAREHQPHRGTRREAAPGGADHPWLGPATEFCWRYLDDPGTEPGPYDVLAVLAFLDHVPDRDRAGRRSGASATSSPPPRGATTTDPRLRAPPGRVRAAALPGAAIDAGLDALIDAQDDDGGWHVGFPAWTPLTGPEWRGFATVESLLTLRAHGRLKP